MKRFGDILFYIITGIMILSGFCIHPLGGILAVKIIHKVSGVLFCILLIRHAVRYKRRIIRKRNC